jgi:hypothetical protein
MRPCGGQQLTTGAQAEVYADRFIANHLKVIGGGKTYAQPFGTIGAIARIAAIAPFIAAAVMLVLGGLGLMYARRTSPDTDIFISRTARSPEPGSAPIPATLNEGNGLADAAPVSSPS